MDKDRISLDKGGDMHSEPFITTEDHLRERQDKSKMPWTAEHERDQQREPSQDNDTSREQRSRSAGKTRKQAGRSQRQTRTARKNEDKESDPEDVERQAVQKLVKQLKDRGMSDQFIEENMDKIRERVRKELR